MAGSVVRMGPTPPSRNDSEKSDPTSNVSTHSESTDISATPQIAAIENRITNDSCSYVIKHSGGPKTIYVEVSPNYAIIDCPTTSRISLKDFVATIKKDYPIPLLIKLLRRCLHGHRKSHNHRIPLTVTIKIGDNLCTLVEDNVPETLVTLQNESDDSEDVVNVDEASENESNSIDVTEDIIIEEAHASATESNTDETDDGEIRYLLRHARSPRPVTTAPNCAVPNRAASSMSNGVKRISVRSPKPVYIRNDITRGKHKVGSHARIREGQPNVKSTFSKMQTNVTEQAGETFKTTVLEKEESQATAGSSKMKTLIQLTDQADKSSSTIKRVILDASVEEVQYQKPSSLAFSRNTVNLRTQDHYTICLPRRACCTSSLIDSQSRHRPNIQSSSSSRVANESSTRSAQSLGILSPNKHTKEVIALLHAAEYAQILQLLGKLPDNPSDESYIPSYFIAGVAHFKMSNYQEAQRHFQKCAAAALRVHQNGNVMLCNAYLGDIEYVLQNYEEAARYYKTSVEHYEYGNENVATMHKLTPPSLSAIHAKRASSFRNSSRMVEAVKGYRAAIDMAQTERDRLSAHTSLGNLYQSMGDNSNALKEYKESIAIATKLSDHVSLGWAHGNIGNAYLGLNKKDEAVHHLQKSLDLAVEYECTPQAIGRTYNNLGTAYQSMNDLDKAEEYYDLALSQAIYGNDRAGQARVYGNIGNVHMLRKNYEQAIPHYGEVLRLSKDPSTISTAQHNRGCAYYEWATSLCTSCTSNTSIADIRYSIHGPECDVDHCLSKIPLKARELFESGSKDLQEVVKHHEERFQHIKGSSQGLTLSVSLFESNSRTFHRLQDCLVNLHRAEQALLVAEQSRARTLGELMLKRKQQHLKEMLTSPLPFEDVKNIVQKQACPLVYFSYTGARLIGWVFVPHGEEISMNMFDVPLSDELFEGKSFDYHLRYSLTEKLVERSFEMYQSIIYDHKSSEPVQTLFRLIAKPTLEILKKLKSETCLTDAPCQLIVISDSYTSLLPLSCLLDPDDKIFFGDHYGIQVIPSFLTMGIINQLPEVSIEHGDETHDLCIIGDPNIPPFILNDEKWALGRLPYAKREAQWVAHTLKTTPILGDHATKEALLLRLLSAKIVHIATHGSASAGFLAFATFNVTVRPGSTSGASPSNVLLYPEEIEKLHISPALVVLSSCDSGRGTVKADGIQGMARAFILAGAQSVLTTLWKVPDESASVFMQFFYQYLTDGLQSSVALQKSILSVRCFAKYSQYIHWSGYQLTGRNICYAVTVSPSEDMLKKRLGNPSIFPRLDQLKELEKSLVKNIYLPTDVQMVRGCPGVDPSEVVIDFISSNRKKFLGGIFWINCKHSAFVTGSLGLINKTLHKAVTQLSLNESEQALFVFDEMIELPHTESLLRVLKSKYVHIIVISTKCEYPSAFIKELDQKLVRGCTIRNIDPLSTIHSTQRIVYSVMKDCNFTPSNDDQQVFESLADFTCGSPLIVNITSQFLHEYSTQTAKLHDILMHCASLLALDQTTKTSIGKLHDDLSAPPVRAALKGLPNATDIVEGDKTVTWETNSEYDSWESINRLIDGCNLSTEEKLLLNCLTIFGRSPVPLFYITEISSLITTSSQKERLCGTLHDRLLRLSLMKRYPFPVVYHPAKQSSPTYSFAYVPHYLAQYIWKSLDDIDKVAAIAVAHIALKRLHSLSIHGSTEAFLLCGVCALVVEKVEFNYKLLEHQSDFCEVYSLFCDCQRKILG